MLKDDIEFLLDTYMGATNGNKLIVTEHLDEVLKEIGVDTNLYLVQTEIPVD
jgi:uncharacterized protein YlzI (FlbEa/FlbD family)